MLTGFHGYELANIHDNPSISHHWSINTKILNYIQNTTLNRQLNNSKRKQLEERRKGTIESSPLTLELEFYK